MVRGVPCVLKRWQSGPVFTDAGFKEDDKVFFEALERCAADNARAITQLNAEIGMVRRQAVHHMRGLNGYRSSRG